MTNPGVLEIVRRVLKQAHYTLIPSGDGDDAWDILERNRPSIDLVLTGFCHAGTDRRNRLASKIRQKYRNLSVLFMTGWLPERDKFSTGMARGQAAAKKALFP